MAVFPASNLGLSDGGRGNTISDGNESIIANAG